MAAPQSKKHKIDAHRTIDTDKPVPHCDCENARRKHRVSYGLVATEVVGDLCRYCRHTVFWTRKPKYESTTMAPNRKPKNTSIFSHDEFLYIDSSDIVSSDVADADDLV